MSVDPLVMSCGLFCIGPLIVFLAGVWVGRNAIRLRSPIYRPVDTSAAGYASPQQRAREYVQKAVKQSEQPVKNQS